MNQEIFDIVNEYIIGDRNIAMRKFDKLNIIEQSRVIDGILAECPSKDLSLKIVNLLHNYRVALHKVISYER